MKYSIILPVHNGGEYIKQCVPSILAQTLQDFNLLILENCSNDGTAEWLSSLSDERIKIFPSQQLLSIEDNWARISSIPRNEFMTIIGHDDVLDKDYLKKMNELIVRFPDASLYQSHFRFIDASGSVMRKCKPMNEKITPEDLLTNFLNSSIDTMGTGFMMRSKDFDKAGGVPPYPNLLFADMELWQTMASKSFLAVEPAELFSYRRHAGATTASTNIQVIINALEKFIEYLLKLKVADKKLGSVIEKDGNTLLREYCQGLTHKLLRIPKNQRQGATVKNVIDKFMELGVILNPENPFQPMVHFKIRMGKMIDENEFLYAFYRLFKSIIKKPVFK